jgi:fatty-acyl-CoA synthase
MIERALGKMVVGNLIVTAAGRFPDKEAFYCTSTSRRFSFKQTNERCNRLAHALSDLGLRKGDTVAFLSTNRVEIVEIYFALAKAGLIGIPLNYRLVPAEMIALMREIGAKALVAERRFSEVMRLAERELPQLRQQISFGEGPTGSDLDYETLLARSATTEPDVDVQESDPYYFNLTSGTTGVPKCYQISHYNNSTLGPFFDAMELSRRDVVLSVFPMYGRVGFAWAACSVMYGIRNVLVNFDVETVLRLIHDERVTITNLVPTMAAMLLDSPKLADHDLSSLRGLVFAGSLFPAPIREATMAKLCPHLYEYYGMQETGALVLSTPEDRVRQPNSVGRPILFSEVKVVGADGLKLPPGETGEIIGRSPGTVTMYHENPAKTAETFRQGWVYTGDLGRIDADGYLYINGRTKDLIVTGGQNVHAGEVEERILTHPGVAECAVIGLPDPKWGEGVTAVVVAKGGQTLNADDIMALCRQHLAGFKCPKKIMLQTEPLPRTPTGKVQKFLLVERYGAK